jgi:hypothetical protein
LPKQVEIVDEKVEEKIDTESIENINEKKSLSDFQKDSLLIVKPSYVEKYNFITKENILLE